MITQPPGWVGVKSCGCCDAADSVVIGEVQGMDILRCTNCSTVRSARVLSPDSVYVEGYHRGDGEIHPFDYTAPLSLEHERVNNSRRLIKLERFATPGRLLDVGGGIGTLCAVASERGWESVNLEPIQEAVDYSIGSGVKTILGGIEDVQEGNFDAVTMMHVLEHLPACRASLERARDLLEPSGLLMVEVPHLDSACRRASKQGWLGWWPGQHIYHFTKDTLSGVLERAGLEIVETGTMVLSFDGLILDHYAYIVGLGPAFKRAMALKARLSGQKSTATTEAQGPATDVPPPLRDAGAKRLLLKPLDAIARLEEQLGLGETLYAIARRPA